MTFGLVCNKFNFGTLWHCFCYSLLSLYVCNLILAHIWLFVQFYSFKTGRDKTSSQRVLQPIANPIKNLLYESKGTQDCKYEVRKLKEGNEGKQTLDTKIYPVVWLGTKPLLHPRYWSTHKEYCFLETKSLLGLIFFSQIRRRAPYLYIKRSRKVQFTNQCSLPWTRIGSAQT